MKIRPVGAELLHADGQTDMTQPTVALRNSANSPTESSTSVVQPVQWSGWYTGKSEGRGSPHVTGRFRWCCWT